MRKNWIAFLLAFAMLVMSVPVSASAAEPGTLSTDVIWYADGSCLEIVVTESVTRAAGTKLGIARYTHKNPDGNIEWRATLTGTFNYDGTSATCTAVTCDVDISDTAWYVVRNSTSRLSNVAMATVVMGEKFLGITVSEETYSLRVTCDKDGNISS